MSSKKALIIWAGWEGHMSEQSAVVVNEILDAQGFDVQVTNSTTAFLDVDLQTIDLIVLVKTMSRIAKKELGALTAAVRNGAGLVGFTAQCATHSVKNLNISL